MLFIGFGSFYLVLMRFSNNIIAVFLLALCTLSTSNGLAASTGSATAGTHATIDQRTQADGNNQHSNANVFGIHQQGETAVTVLERISSTLSVEESKDQNSIGAAYGPQLDLPEAVRYYLNRAAFKSGRLQKLLFPFHAHL